MGEADTESETGDAPAFAVRFTFTRTEVAEAFVAIAWASLLLWASEAVLVACGAVLVGADAAMVVYVLVAVVAVRLLILAMGLSRETRHEHTAAFGRERISIEALDHLSEWRWARLVKRSRTFRLELFWVSPRGFLWVPRRSLSEADLGAIAELASAKGAGLAEP